MENLPVDFEKYPFLLSLEDTSKDDTYGDLVSQGWIDIFIQMLDDVKQAMLDAKRDPKELHFVQVKEKFGRLRTYVCIDSVPGDATEEDVAADSELRDKIYDIVDRAEEKSGYICVDCGKPAKFCSVGWVLPFCKECAEKSFKKRTNNLGLEPHFLKLFVPIGQMRDR